jgi:hypothetical protein
MAATWPDARGENVKAIKFAGTKLEWLHFSQIRLRLVSNWPFAAPRSDERLNQTGGLPGHR